MGASMVGDPVVQRVQSSYIRAPGLLDRLDVPPAWATITMNTVRNGSVYAIDGRETFLVHNYLRPDEEDFDAIDRAWSIRQILGVEDSFTWDMLGNEDWIGRRLVADRFRDDGAFARRVFLCGDAAHIWVPYAGYGMNAGIADAENLAWLLAAHLSGWAPAAILDAHEAERLPITEQVSRFAMGHAEKMIRARGAVPAEIDDDTPEGEAARSQAAQAAYDLNVQQYAAAGLNFGYYYENSPLIAADGAPPPTPWAALPPRRSPAAVRPTSGSTMAARSTMPTGRAIRCCASIRPLTRRRWRRQWRQRVCPFRSWTSTRHPAVTQSTTASSSSPGPTVTLPGGAIGCRTIR